MVLRAGGEDCRATGPREGLSAADPEATHAPERCARVQLPIDRGGGAGEPRRWQEKQDEGDWDKKSEANLPWRLAFKIRSIGCCSGWAASSRYKSSSASFDVFTDETCAARRPPEGVKTRVKKTKNRWSRVRGQRVHGSWHILVI